MLIFSYSILLIYTYDIKIKLFFQSDFVKFSVVVLHWGVISTQGGILLDAYWKAIKR